MEQVFKKRKRSETDNKSKSNNKHKQFSSGSYYILPIEIWQFIFELTDFSSQVFMRMTCKFFYQLDIVNLLNIPVKIKAQFDNEILIRFTKLKYLDLNYAAQISPNVLQNLNLFTLKMNNQIQITNLNHMSNLRILHVAFGSGFTNEGIAGLTNLVELCIMCNKNITKIGHLIWLECLYAE